jgi:hypothetical protein
MSEPGCAPCSFRVKYDTGPQSLPGRLWRWHANCCPGWKASMRSLPDDEKREIVERYSFRAEKSA